MAIDTNTQTFTDAQLLAFYRKALVSIAEGGQAVGMTGNQLTRANLKDVRETIEWLEQRVADASSGSSGGIGLAGFGERV